MTIDSVTSLVQTLRSNSLLLPEQLEEITRSLQGRFTDPRQLARELLRRGWLTPYQINQVFLGRGLDLRLGPYLLLERVGEGAMGRVFKARHQKLDRVVAIKIIRKERMIGTDIMRRFHREIQAVAHLSHPHIIHAYDADQVDDVFYYAMEYIEGIDFGQLVKLTGPLPIATACDYIRQAALGLQHALERGLVHRDIKPSNLLVVIPGSTKSRSSGPRTADMARLASQASSGGLVKILDLGLALMQGVPSAELSGTLTQAQMVLGTPDFIAPEQACNAHNVDIRSDLYSLGCTFYYLLTGQVPFPGVTAMEKLLKHHLDEPRPVSTLRPNIPANVVAIVEKLMAKRPEERYQTPLEVAQALAVPIDNCRVRAPSMSSIQVPITPTDPPITSDGPSWRTQEARVDERNSAAAFSDGLYLAAETASDLTLATDTAESFCIVAAPQSRFSSRPRRWLSFSVFLGLALLVCGIIFVFLLG